MVSYEFYTGDYRGGSVPSESWPRYEARAGEQLARYQRLYTVTVPEGVADGEAMAVCAMAEALYSLDLVANGEAGTVQSASIGSVSVSYGGAGQAVDLSPQGQARELYRCACRYLDIRRGCGPC